MKFVFALLLALCAIAPARKAMAMEDMGGGYSCYPAVVEDSFGNVSTTYYGCTYTGGYGGDGGGYSYWDGETGGGGGGGYYDSNYCNMLLISKPAGCDSDVGRPSGPDYGAGQYAAGTGLAKLIYLHNSGLALPYTNSLITAALTTHTQQGASLVVSRDVYDAQLLKSLQEACEYQAQHALYGADGTRKCFDDLTILASESSGTGTLEWIRNYAQANSLQYSYGGFDIQSLVSMFAPESSLAVKARIVTAAATCAMWWEDVHANGCG